MYLWYVLFYVIVHTFLCNRVNVCSLDMADCEYILSSKQANRQFLKFCSRGHVDLRLTCNSGELRDAFAKVLLVVIQPSRTPSLGLGARGRARPKPHILPPLIGG